MWTHLNNFVPLLAFKVVFFALDGLQPSSHVEPVVSIVPWFFFTHIFSPVKTVRSNLYCKTTLQQKPVGRVTRWMPLTPLGQCKFGCSAPQDPVGRPPAREGVIYDIS